MCSVTCSSNINQVKINQNLTETSLLSNQKISVSEVIFFPCYSHLYPQETEPSDWLIDHHKFTCGLTFEAVSWSTSRKQTHVLGVVDRFHLNLRQTLISRCLSCVRLCTCCSSENKDQDQSGPADPAVFQMITQESLLITINTCLY